MTAEKAFKQAKKFNEQTMFQTVLAQVDKASSEGLYKLRVKHCIQPNMYEKFTKLGFTVGRFTESTDIILRWSDPRCEGRIRTELDEKKRPTTPCTKPVELNVNGHEIPIRVPTDRPEIRGEVFDRWLLIILFIIVVATIIAVTIYGCN